MTPRLKAPASGPDTRCPTLTMASTSASTWRARLTISPPMTVTLTDLVVRSNSVTPSCVSSFLICVLRVGLVDVAGCGGAAEMAVVGNRHDVAQILQCHVRLPAPTLRRSMKGILSMS